MRIACLLFIFIYACLPQARAQQGWMPYPLSDACTVSLPGYVVQAQMEGVTLASADWQGLALQAAAGPLGWGNEVTLAHLREYAEPPRAALSLQVISFTDTVVHGYKGKYLIAAWRNESGIDEIKIAVCGFINGKEGAVLVFSAAPGLFDDSRAALSQFLNSVVLRDAAPAYNYYVWLWFLPLLFVVWIWLRRKVRARDTGEEDAEEAEE